MSKLENKIRSIYFQNKKKVTSSFFKFKCRIRGEMSVERLKKLGLKIGTNVTFETGCKIDPSHCWHVEIGNDVTFAPKVHILAHDSSTHQFFNYTRVANVKIGNNVFVGLGTIILAGVNIGNNVIIGAGSVVNKDIPDNSVAAGVPAKVICSLNEYLDKEQKKQNAENTFESEYTLRNPNFSAAQRAEMVESAKKWKEIFVN
jgi:maltose O-acetyltransferase